MMKYLHILFTKHLKDAGNISLKCDNLCRILNKKSLCVMFQVLALLCDWFNGSDNIDKSFIFKSLGNTETGSKMGKDLSGEYKEPKVTKLSTFFIFI